MNYFSLYLKGLICFCLLFITMDSHALSIDKGYRQNKIKDLALIYQGGVHRIDWTSDQFLPYVVHQFADGHKDWLFDGFLFWSSQMGKAVALQHATQIKMQEKRMAMVIRSSF
ncbi:DUF4855 domain-containing protein [Bacteroides thetaiotaomicron]|uniref:DUF4855 domain-containing protein n=1 Tax=Bacteroides thetaiotaomicron TaxID=818 RepID=UPI001F5BEB4D|nr:DUF4855 domain-containing protein [Bacteroides thetaiotaomicron]